MSRIRLAVALSVLLAPAAFALNNRSAVASSGLDTNPCTVASPCRSFGVAIAATNSGGEVIALDSAGYGPFSISNAITVSGAPGVHAAITVSSGSGIAISAPGSHIVLRNLVLIGAGLTTNGIVQFVAGHVYVNNCLVRGFENNIDVQNGAATIDHCQVLDPVAEGILLEGNGVITDCTIVGGGVYVDASADVSVVRTTITECNTAVYAPNVTGSGYHTVINLKDCTITNNSFAVAVASSSNNSAYAYLSGNLIAYNDILASVSGAAAIVYSFQNNAIDSNNSAGAAMTNVSLQ